MTNRHESKEVEHALEMLHAIFDGIDEIVYIIDPDTNMVLFANKKTKELFGEEIEGKKCHLVFHKQNRPCRFCIKDKISENQGK
ncbi:MAG: PAS domain-containing protein, partial [Candidatus Bathyarchaeia archaeon]